MGLSSDVFKKYEYTKFSGEDSIVMDQISNSIKDKEVFNTHTLEDIHKSYGLLEEDILITLILYLLEITDSSILELFNNEFSSNKYFEVELKRNVIHSLKRIKNYELNFEETKKLCLEIYNLESDNISLYIVLSKMVNDELLELIIQDFQIKPKKEMNYLLVFALKSRKILNNFIKEFNSENYEQILLVILSCLEISKTDSEFAFIITKQKLICKMDIQWDSVYLINNYLLLLFTLLLNNENEILEEEIEYIVNNFKRWRLDSIVFLLYRNREKINKSCSASLYSLFEKTSNNDINNLKHSVSCIYSALSDGVFSEFMLPVLSIVGLDNGKEILTRIQKKLDFFLDIIIKETIDMRANFKISLKVLKSLYLGNKLLVIAIDENSYIKLLRMFHYYELDGVFVCNIAIDLLLGTAKPKIQKELYNYIISSIYDNYFYILYDKVINMTDSKLDELKVELKNRKCIREISMSNPDFKPSEKNMNIYFEKQAEMNRKLHERAEKLSIFANLFSKQTILYGNKVQYKHFSEEGEPITEISEMHELSYSMPIPVRYNNDPLFYQYELNSILEVESND